LSTQWQFSDGTTTTLTSPVKTFNSSGVKTIVLTMIVRNTTTQTTCTKTVTKNINVNTNPCASHKAYNTSTKSGKTITFTNKSLVNPTQFITTIKIKQIENLSNITQITTYIKAYHIIIILQTKITNNFITITSCIAIKSEFIQWP
jgi:PKD repeat protein